MIIKILAALVCVVIMVIVTVMIKSKQEETQHMYTAAERMIQNDILDNSLKNPFIKGTVIEEEPERQLMLNVKVSKSGKKQNFVFNPAKVVNIGRERTRNQITINEAVVSNFHCKIYLLQNDTAVVEDCNSSNGTVLKRGMKSYVIANGQNAVLEDGDKLIIGTVELKIKLFYYDTIWM